MPRAKKEKKPLELRVPEPLPGIDNWVILGLDPSVSRTGFALAGLYLKDETAQPQWLGIGSVKPDKIEDYRHTRTTLWARSKAIALFVREYLKLVPVSKQAQPNPYGDFEPAPPRSRTGLLISMEYPTPQNDFLVGLNRILHVILFEDGTLADTFKEIRILTPNASTLRSLMGLRQRGSTNKKENIEKAYEFVPKEAYPQLDSDSCDAVLMAMMGQYAATILMGKPSQIPPSFLARLCNANVIRKVSKKGRVTEKIEGILLRPEYWYAYEKLEYRVLIKDASLPTRKLIPKGFVI